jgi:glyoxylase-like metal-dependent hydrolase (beta-lactamase superfamily II)
MSGAVLVHQFELGPWNNFIYFVGDRTKGQVAVVDPAWDVQTILDEARRLDLRITHILCSHSHFDHVDQVGALLERLDLPVYMLRQELEFSGFRCENLVASRPGDRVNIGDCAVTMVHTPGHTPGSVSYQIDDALIAGDTLFVNGCGRCDFVGGDPEIMFQTLKSLIERLSPETRIYPGHNYGPTPSTTIGVQQRDNPFLRHTTLRDFVAHRMEGKKPGSPLPARPLDWVPARVRASGQ